jgi:hypothetical protein
LIRWSSLLSFCLIFRLMMNVSSSSFWSNDIVKVYSPSFIGLSGSGKYYSSSDTSIIRISSRRSGSC